MKPTLACTWDARSFNLPGLKAWARIPSKGEIHFLGRSPTRDVEQRTPSFSTLVAHLSLDDTTLQDLHLGRRTSATRAPGLDRFNNVHALDDLAENDMFAVEPGRHGCRDEELGDAWSS